MSDLEESKQIPKGYWEDGNGALIPINKVKDIDKKRDKLVKSIVKNASNLSGVLADFRNEVFDMIAEFTEESAREYGASLGGKKGNLTLYSYDKRFKIVVAVGETKQFDERLQIAKQLIDDCIQKWMKGSNHNIQALVSDAFQVDRQGKVSVDKILGLRKLKIEDENWAKAMEAIADSIQITGSKKYFRIYERVGEADSYVHIPLDVANA